MDCNKGDLSDKTEQKTVSCYLHCSSPAVSRIQEINVTDANRNLHLGTNVTLNGPVILQGLTVQDIFSINGIINRKRKKLKLKKESKKKKEPRLKKSRKESLKSCSLKKCLFLVSLFIVIQAIIFVSLLKRETGNICVQQLHEMNTKLPFFIPRTSWGQNHNCPYGSYLKEFVKTKIKFTIIHPFLWKCLNKLQSLYDNSICNDEFVNEFNNHTNHSTFPLNDIYYNYVVSYRGHTYEGRPLNCGFEKKENEVLNQNLSEVIVLGVSYCFQNGVMNPFKYQNELNPEIPALAIRQLTDSLKGIGVLSENYVMEFPSVCNDTELVNYMKLKHPNITFNYNETDLFDNIKLSEETVEKFRRIILKNVILND